ncbi:MAG: hypothetical protein IT294_08525 [Deltaproteobacteria bacterium]|nr:hypothetical protein [Deltaproteobacteria bacterium]
MKTKTSSRSAKKTPARPSSKTVRARAGKTTPRKTAAKKATAARATAKPSAAKPAQAGKRAGVTTTAAVKYRQSGAPWWKQFI